MQARRLAVCGWDESVPALLAALAGSSSFRATCVVDHGTAALVRAREATGLPCALSPATALRDVDVQAILLAAPGHAAAAVEVARRRGIPLLLAAEWLDPDSLRLVAAAAAEDAIPMVSLRPAYRAAGLRGIVAAARTVALEALTLDLAGDEPRLLLQAAVAAALRALPGVPDALVASAWGSPCAQGGVTVTLRYADGRLAMLGARRAEAPSLRVQAETLAGPVTLRRPAHTGDALHRELERAAKMLRHDPAEAALLQAEASVLLALDATLESGEVTPVERPRTALQLVAAGSGGHASAATAQGGRTHRLRLVVS